MTSGRVRKIACAPPPNPTTLRPSQIPAKKAGKSPKKLIADGFDFEPDLQRKKFPNTKFNRCSRIYIYKNASKFKIALYFVIFIPNFMSISESVFLLTRLFLSYFYLDILILFRKPPKLAQLIRCNCEKRFPKN